MGSVTGFEIIRAFVRRFRSRRNTLSIFSDDFSVIDESHATIRDRRMYEGDRAQNCARNYGFSPPARSTIARSISMNHDVDEPDDLRQRDACRI